MTDTFPGPATSQSTGTTTAAVKRAKFGDGYAQAAADGLNATSRSYQLQFVGNRKTINEIVTFLDGHAGRSFLLTEYEPVGSHGDPIHDRNYRFWTHILDTNFMQLSLCAQ